VLAGVFTLTLHPRGAPADPPKCSSDQPIPKGRLQQQTLLGKTQGQWSLGQGAACSGRLLMSPKCHARVFEPGDSVGARHPCQTIREFVEH
jgi:hypothetical protein